MCGWPGSATTRSAWNEIIAPDLIAISSGDDNAGRPRPGTMQSEAGLPRAAGG